MARIKSLQLWTVNGISFVLLVILLSTGLLNWLVLPKGYEARGSFLVSVRHFLVDFHAWTAMIFVIVIALHVYLHWPYVKAQMRKSKKAE
jgi:membrane protein implicated in regulation of membrane protease activity